MVHRKALNVGVVINRQKPGAAALVRELEAYSLANHEIKFFWETSAASLLRKKGVSLKHIIKKADLLLVAGGDGSLLGVAREVFPAQIPILGVNIGSLGFLTSVAQSEVMSALQLIARRKWELSKRLVLETTIYSKGRRQKIPCSLNDVVISRGAHSRLVRIKVSVGDSFLTEYVCDGLIISTPTGSTAYAVSAGGPMISPDAKALAITPICAHTLTNRALVIGPDSPIRIEFPPQSSSLLVQCDGQTGCSVRTGDWLEIGVAKASVQLAYTPNRDFYTILREKLKWSGASLIKENG